MSVTGSNPVIELCDEPLDLSSRQHRRNIKQSLKTLIETRRLAEGKDLISVSFDRQESISHQLTPEELQRQNDRKEQNRKAAHRCRQKKKHRLQFYFMEKERLKIRQHELQETLQKLEEEKAELLQTLRTGGTVSNELTAFDKNEEKCLCHQQNNEVVDDGENEDYISNQNTSNYVPGCPLHDVLTSNSSDLKNDEHVKILNYYTETSASNDSCSNSDMFVIGKNRNSNNILEDSSSDTSDSEDYLFIYESETDSSDIFSNSQSS